MVYSAIYLSYIDNMHESEYIRAHTSPSKTSLLSFPILSGTAILTFLHAGHFVWPDNDMGLTAVSERGHNHAVYHAILYTSGRNTMIHDCETHFCKRGTLVLTDPGCIHEYRPQSPGGCSFIEITFNLKDGDSNITKPWNEVIRHWLGCNFENNIWPVIIPPPELEHLESMMIEILRVLSSSSPYSEAAASLALGGFILNLTEYLNDEQRSREGNYDRLDQARIELERNFTEPLSIPELASIACLSEGAFIRSFSARYKIPPMAYRKKLRITAAKHLLSVSGRTIGEIAGNVGYRDIFAFSRTFKAVVGMTASEWRRKGTEE